MRILHLYSDWRWTGPAEPAVQMCKALEERGHEVVFACRKTPAEFVDQEKSVEIGATKHGINFTTEFGLNRYFGLKDTIRDITAIPRYLKNEGIDVLHTHLSHDHGLGAYSTWRAHKQDLVWVKHMHRRTPLDDNFWNRRLLCNMKKRQGIMVFTESFRDMYADTFGIPKEQIGMCPMPMDQEKFHRNAEYQSLRDEWKIPDGAVVIGIVARYQKYRRMDTFMQAARKVVDEYPNAYFVVIGRSSQMAETVIKPMKENDLEDNVVLAGYLTDKYLDGLASLDIFTLTTPGFDGTARALREAMSLGKPSAISDVGMLPDIAPHEKAGLVWKFGDADDLAACWKRLIADSELRKKMGEYAATRAEAEFRFDLIGPSLENFYEQLSKA